MKENNREKGEWGKAQNKHGCKRFKRKLQFTEEKPFCTFYVACQIYQIFSY